MVGWGLGRRSVAVLILGQVTRVGTIHRRRWGGGDAKGGGLGVSNVGWLVRNTPLPVYSTYLPTYLPGRANTKHQPANWLIPCQTCGNSTKYVSSGFVTRSTPCYPFFSVSTKSGVWESTTVPRIALPVRRSRSYSSLLRSEFQEVCPVVPLPLAVYILTSRQGYRRRIDIRSREKLNCGLELAHSL